MLSPSSDTIASLKDLAISFLPYDPSSPLSISHSKIGHGEMATPASVPKLQGLSLSQSYNHNETRFPQLKSVPKCPFVVARPRAMDSSALGPSSKTWWHCILPPSRFPQCPQEM
ncbi:hypothetical protein V6N13_100261 [Hibiscus sabdariffa]|uniref:Uncharacterized protein n=1 Tax=Hibiscus sabdariffa TaxID=183260 RepID=A0ABR2B7L6_9ROSI